MPSILFDRYRFRPWLAFVLQHRGMFDSLVGPKYDITVKRYVAERGWIMYARLFIIHFERGNKFCLCGNSQADTHTMGFGIIFLDCR